MQPTLKLCVNQLGDSEAHRNNFPGDYEYEWLGFQAFGPLVQLGVSCPIHLGAGSISESKGSFRSHPHQSLSWGSGGREALSCPGLKISPLLRSLIQVDNTTRTLGKLSPPTFLPFYSDLMEVRASRDHPLKYPYFLI